MLASSPPVPARISIMAFLVSWGSAGSRSRPARSRTSSRKPFLDAVTPRYALVSAGPTLNNGGVSFPESEVINALEWSGAKVLRTDLNDRFCPETDRVGVDDTKPGGCDNYVLEISP